MYNEIQSAINNIGYDNVIQSIPVGTIIVNCDMHGSYLAHKEDKSPHCPLCAYKNVGINPGNGASSTITENNIDARDAFPLIINL